MVIMGKSNVIKENYESPKIHHMTLENEHVLLMSSHPGNGNGWGPGGKPGNPGNHGGHHP